MAAIAAVNAAAERELAAQMESEGVAVDVPAHTALVGASSVMRLLRQAVASDRSLYGTKAKSLKDMFCNIDRDGSGSVSREEFIKALERLDVVALTREQMEAAADELDNDGDGQVDWQEFLGGSGLDEAAGEAALKHLSQPRQPTEAELRRERVGAERRSEQRRARQEAQHTRGQNRAHLVAGTPPLPMGCSTHTQT